jgi:hypothetical protein
MVIGANAQTDDNILWSKFGVQKSLNDQTTLHFAPIIRFNEDISKYQNISFDYAVSRNLGKGWAAKLTGRTWFLPSGRERQFIWPQISYSKTLEKIKLSSYLRYHWALDIKDIEDPDFIRWDISMLLLNLGKKFQASLGIEPWLRLNSFGEIQRVRYKPGLRYLLSDNMNLDLTLWHEQNTNLANGSEFNIWVLSLNYKLK